MTDCTCGRANDRAAAAEALDRLIECGLRPREWDGPSVERLRGLADACLASVEANLLLYYRFLDTGEPEQAAVHLNRLLDVGERVAPAFQAELALTAAYFAARHAGDAEAARAWLAQAPPDGAHAALRAQAEAAVLIAEGRYSAGRDVAEAGLLNLRDGLLGGLSSVQADALRELLDRATAALPAPPAVLACSTPAGESEPAARPAPSAAAPAARETLAAGPTLGLGMAIALVAIVTLVIAVMPLPRGGSLRISSPSGGPSFTRTDPTDDIGPIHISICKDGCQVESVH